MRNYFSAYPLWTAEEMTGRARDLEAKHSGGPRFDIQHRALVLSAVLAAAGFPEAMINELYQNATDEHGVSDDGYIAPLTSETRRLMAQLWVATDEGSKLRALDKYQLMLSVAGKAALDPGTQPFQDAQLLVVMALRSRINGSHQQRPRINAELHAPKRVRLERLRFSAGVDGAMRTSVRDRPASRSRPFPQGDRTPRALAGRRRRSRPSESASRRPTAARPLVRRARLTEVREGGVAVA
jgi:hypothetical protein